MEISIPFVVLFCALFFALLIAFIVNNIMFSFIEKHRSNLISEYEKLSNQYEKAIEEYAKNNVFLKNAVEDLGGLNRLELKDKRVCPGCGEEFKPVLNSQKYCSVKCRKAFHWRKYWKINKAKILSRRNKNTICAQV